MRRTLLGLALWLAAAATLAAQTPGRATTPTGKSQTYVSPVSANIPAAADKPAALVNGEMLSMLEVKALLETRPYPNTLKADEVKACRQAAVDLLVEDMLIRQYLTKYAPAVAPADVAKELRTLEDQLKKGNKTLADLVRENGQSLEQLRKDVVARLQWRGYLQHRLKDDAARKYYDDNKPFFDKVMVRASHILVKVPAKATPEQKQVLLNKAETIRQEVVAGKLSFETAVQKYSECPSRDKEVTDQHGKKVPAPGDLGPFPFKFVVVEPFAQAAFNMKVGAISGIVTTEFGYHIIKVTDRTQPKETLTYEQVRDAVREIWAQDIELYRQILTHQKKNSKIEVFLQ